MYVCLGCVETVEALIRVRYLSAVAGDTHAVLYIALVDKDFN